MFLKRTGLKYKFMGLSIGLIVLSAVSGSVALHHLITLNQNYSFFYVLTIALVFTTIGVLSVLLVSKLMVQPVITLTKKIQDVENGSLEVRMDDCRSGARLDEMDRLFDGFEHMVQHLRGNIAALTKSKEEAEAYSVDLTESRNKLEAIFNGMSDGIMIIDEDFRVVSANPVIEKIMGRELAEIQGQQCYEMCNGTSQRCSYCKADVVLQKGEHLTSYCTKTVEGMGERVFEIHDFPLYGESGEIDRIIEYVKDVTDAVKMQQRLESSNRLAAIGEMAAKVAHEVRNPLNAIQGAAHYLRKTSSEDSDGYLRLIEEQVERVNKVATNMLVLSKPLQAVLYLGRLEDVVDRTLVIAQSQLKEKNIQVTKKFAPGLPGIPLDTAQMERACLNLILNAADAMQPAGQLQISIAANGNGKNGASGEHETLQMLLRDDGSGIPEGNHSELFEPFYTTKTKGTGLGLTIVKKIIDNHNGSIEIHSQPGKGTEIALNLPLNITKHETKIQDFSS